MANDSTGQLEAVTFDLDGTLVRYRRSPGEVLETAFASLEIDPLFSVEEYYARYDEFAANCESMNALRSACFAALAAENGYEPQQGRDVADAFRAERNQSNVELLPAADRVLEEVSRRYPVAIITNGASDAQRQKIDAVDLRRWVDTIVIAGHEIPPKPDPEPFERALNSLGVSGGHAVHVGDSLETDIAGANAVGLDSVWISSDSGHWAVEPTYCVDSIANVLDLPWME